MKKPSTCKPCSRKTELVAHGALHFSDEETVISKTCMTNTQLTSGQALLAKVSQNPVFFHTYRTILFCSLLCSLPLHLPDQYTHCISLIQRYAFLLTF